MEKKYRGKKKEKKEHRKEKRGAEYRTRELWLDSLMVSPPTLQRHELGKSIHATFLYPTARLPPLFDAVASGARRTSKARSCSPPTTTWILGAYPFSSRYHDQINCKKESYRLSSTCGAPRNHKNVPPVDAHV